MHPIFMGGARVSLAAIGAVGLPAKLSHVEGSMIRRSPNSLAEPIQAVRFPADQSRLRAFHRKRSTGSSTVGIEAPASIAVTLSWLSPTSHKLLHTSSGTPHDDAIPVDLTLSLRRLRAFGRGLSMILARDPVRREASHSRVADEPGGGRPKPFASLSLRSALTTTP